jgi:hypothetical protein
MPPFFFGATHPLDLARLKLDLVSLGVKTLVETGPKLGN